MYPIISNTRVWCCFLMFVGQVMSTENRIPHSKAKLMTNDDWAKKLTAEQYFVTREQGTEPVRSL